MVLLKMVLIKHLYGLYSMRRTAEEVQMNLTNRWFLRYLLNKPTPHLSALSYNVKHRFSEAVVEEVFTWILSEIESAGYLSSEAVVMDGTHIKANANIKKDKEAYPSCGPDI